MIAGGNGDGTSGLKRVRLVASIVAAGMFGFTAIQQFRVEGPEFLLPGVILSAIIGFVGVFVLMTIVIYLMKLFRKGE